jgi:hypothetical protein
MLFTCIIIWFILSILIGLFVGRCVSEMDVVQISPFWGNTGAPKPVSCQGSALLNNSKNQRQVHAMA